MLYMDSMRILIRRELSIRVMVHEPLNFKCVLVQNEFDTTSSTCFFNLFYTCHCRHSSTPSLSSVYTQELLLVCLHLYVHYWKMSVTWKRHVNGQVVPYKMSIWDAFKGVPPPRPRKPASSVSFHAIQLSSPCPPCNLCYDLLHSPGSSTHGQIKTWLRSCR